MKNIYLTFLLIASTCLFIGCGEDDPVVVAGCMDNAACNYNENATEDDGSCQLPSASGLELISDDDIVVTGPMVPANPDFDPQAIEGITPNYDVVSNRYYYASNENELTSYIQIRNASCMDMTLSVSQELIEFEPGQESYQIKFCIGDPDTGMCYDWGKNNSEPEHAVTLASFEEGNVVQGYLRARIAGTYVVKYTITSCCSEELEVEVTYIVE